MKLLTPTTLDEALAALATSDTEVVPCAGGTDLMVDWHHQDKQDWCLMDLSRLDALRGLRLTADTLELGALVTYWQVFESDEVRAALPLMAQVAHEVGAVQIQTRGTWAGNIANGSPAADGVPVMMAYGASAVLQDQSGEQQVPLDKYFTGYKQNVRRPQQLIVGIRIPLKNREFEWWHKVGSRSAQAIAKVGVAMVKDPGGWHVAVNSVAPTVLRCRILEQQLNAGRSFHSPSEVKDALLRDISPIDDLRSTAKYRTNVLANLIYHKLQEMS